MEVTAETRRIRRDALVPVGPFRGGHLFHDRCSGTSYWLSQGEVSSTGGPWKVGAWVGALVGAPLIHLVGTGLLGNTGDQGTWVVVLVGLIAAAPLALVVQFTAVRQRLLLTVVHASSRELLGIRRLNRDNIRNMVIFALGYPVVLAVLGRLAQEGPELKVAITFAWAIGLLPMWVHALSGCIEIFRLTRAWEAEVEGPSTF